jgi:hypothetical protein
VYLSYTAQRSYSHGVHVYPVLKLNITTNGRRNMKQGLQRKLKNGKVKLRDKCELPANVR